MVIFIVVTTTIASRVRYNGFLPSVRRILLSFALAKPFTRILPCCAALLYAAISPRSDVRQRPVLGFLVLYGYFLCPGTKNALRGILALARLPCEGGFHLALLFAIVFVSVIM